ncbi:radical SAM protein, partial [bacterium]|nr:radical SAM protein [candidate division CSSED10-310 bacterium]
DGVTLGWDGAAVAAMAREFQPELVVLLTSTPSIYSDVSCAGGIKAVCPGAYVVLVGPHVSALPAESIALSDAVDAVAMREFEDTLVELADRLARGDGVHEVAGLALRHAGGIKVNPHRPFIQDLDRLPFVSSVYKDFLKPSDYFYSIARWPMMTIITGRGCVHHCAYCVYPQVQCGHQCRYRDVRKVVEEFRYIQETFPEVKEIFIEDDTLTVDRERCMEFCDLLASAGLHLTFTANSRAEIDFDQLKALKRAGCRLLCVGFESGVEELLANMRKRNTLARARQFVRDAKRAGVMVHGCFLVGNEGETPATMRATLEYAKSLNTDTAQFFPIMVYPGTVAYEWVKENGYLTTTDFSAWLSADGMHNCVVDLPGLSAADMVAFCDRARREYYLRPRYLVFKLWQTLRHPTEAQRTLKSFRTFYKHLFKGSQPGHAPG